MTQTEKIKIINDTLAEYFAKTDNPRKVPAKDLMPEFIRAGVFKTDNKGGLPIRRLLRELDKSDKLSLIPYVLAERKDVNVSWYFIATGFAQNVVNTEKVRNKKVSNSRAESDEYYVISLCNEVLNAEASQQHRFDFLKGDSGISLPIDAYYEHLNLVIEYHERQHTESIKFFNKKTTVSGVSRDEQRRIYDERRMTVLPKHGINVIVIDYSRFGTSKKIKRDHDKDILIIKQILVENGIL